MKPSRQKVEQCEGKWNKRLIISFQFTLKVLATDSDDAPLKESTVAIDGDDGTTTGEDGTTTNNDKKFEFGSKVSITVTAAGPDVYNTQCSFS